MTRVDKLLLMLNPEHDNWLGFLTGVGPATLAAARAAGFITTKMMRPGGFGSRRSSDHRVELTNEGKARRAELIVERDRRAAEIAAERAAQMGRCICCGAVARQGPYGSWYCSNADCIASKTNVPADYWRALRRAVDRLEHEAAAAVAHVQQHPHGCRCRECYVG